MIYRSVDTSIQHVGVHCRYFRFAVYINIRWVVNYTGISYLFILLLLLLPSQQQHPFLAFDTFNQIFSYTQGSNYSSVVHLLVAHAFPLQHHHSTLFVVLLAFYSCWAPLLSLSGANLQTSFHQRKHFCRTLDISKYSALKSTF